MNSHLHPVLIGVDGSHASRGAVRAGLAEAQRRGVPIRLVHVVPDYFPLAPLDPATGRELTAIGADILERARADVVAMAAGVHVETQLRHGGSARQLAIAAEQAAVLFVGRDDRSALQRVLLGNTAAGAAARATCPVVSVPSDWDPEVVRGEVVVGVKSSAHSTELLADGFAAADALQGRLVVLHAWKLPSAYDDIIAARIDGEARAQSSKLESLLPEWRNSYPDVEVEVRVVHDQPAHALVAAARTADLLILVRHSHGFPTGMLGGTGRALLREAACPVRVIPPGEVTAVPGLVLERGGELDK